MRHWSFYALLATVVLLPWYVIRWQIAGIPTTLLEIAAFITIGVWVIEKTVYREWARVVSFWRGQRVLVFLLLLFIVAALVGTFVSSNHRESLGILKAYIIEPLLLLVIAVDQIGSEPQRWWQLAAALWAAGLQVSLASVSQAIWHWPVTAPAEMAQGRSSSFYNTANAVGLFMGPLVALAAGSLLAGRFKRWPMIALTIWSALALLAIGLSHSRGAFLGCAAIAVVFGLGWLTRRVGWVLSDRVNGAVMVVAVVLYAALSLSYVWFINNPPKVANPYTRPGFSTLTVRQCLWQGAKGMLEASPITGAGLGGFTQNYLKHITCDAEPLVYPHLFVLNFWSELGLLGLVSVLAVVVWWLTRTSRVAWSSTGWHWIGVGLTAAMAYWLIHGLDDVPYFKNDLSVEWWLILALVVTLPLVIERELPTGLPERS